MSKYLNYIDEEVPRWHTASKDAEAGIVEALHGRFLEPGSMQFVLIMPLERASLMPQLVVMYGLPAQISTVAKALIWHGAMPETQFLGMASCTLIPLTYKSGRVHINIPGTGELILGRTENHEIGIVVPSIRQS